MSDKLKMPLVADLQICGRATKDPEFSYTPKGTAVCQFDIAKDQYSSGKKQDPLYLRVVCFGQTAERVRDEVGKGVPVLIKGTLQCRRYVDSQGRPQTAWEVAADRVHVLVWAGRADGDGDGNGAKTATSATRASNAAVDDDMPF